MKNLFVLSPILALLAIFTLGQPIEASPAEPLASTVQEPDRTPPPLTEDNAREYAILCSELGIIPFGYTYVWDWECLVSGGADSPYNRYKNRWRELDEAIDPIREHMATLEQEIAQLQLAIDAFPPPSDAMLAELIRQQGEKIAEYRILQRALEKKEEENLREAAQELCACILMLPQ